MEHVLAVEDLKVAFSGDKGRSVSVDGVSFQVDPGEVVCLVGESGCGKSVTSLAVMGLLGRGGQASGTVRFLGQELLGLSEKELDKVRGNHLTMIFQDPLSALNPVFPIGKQLMESMEAHMSLEPKEREARAKALLEKVGLGGIPSVMEKYPHQLSGGQRQRVMIAMALSCNPELLIADEPTTALDVTIQAQILDLMRNLKKTLNTSIMMITHDLGVVAEMSDYVLVMYAGMVMEYSDVTTLFDRPLHPYTQGLMKALPRLDDPKDVLYAIDGTVPSLYDLPAGCRFWPRCPYATERCKQEIPELYHVGDRKVRCFRYENGLEEDVHNE